ncbi:MAG: prephenate dehydrogenase/arogenate dehydrogenase family protein [Planctomycetales bacterium]|nr:prephenate dehydrogenase/arogenate dehydrogenase family protein [Planctomycetales bacterium]
MPTRFNVAIIGVGLIGGSVGLALRQRKLATKVVGVGRRAGSLAKARRCGAVDATTTQLARGVRDADLVVVCSPVEMIAQHVRQAAAACPAGALITDAGSTKASLVAELSGPLGRDVRFVGSHPLAGSEKTGPENASAALFEDRLVVVTPSDDATAKDVRAIENFWRSLGARTVRMNAAEHDAAVAATSHAPHVIAAALAAATDARHLPLVAGGWLDTTRIAAADAQLWRQILLDNRQNTLAALDAFEARLAEFRAALSEADGARLARLLDAGKKRRDQSPRKRS